MGRQSAFEPLRKSRRQFEYAFVSVNRDHVARPFQYCGAVSANAKMLFHGGAQSRIKLLFHIIRYLAPNFFAAHSHGFASLANNKRPIQIPPRPSSIRESMDNSPPTETVRPE